MGSELGNETCNDVLLVPSALYPPKFHIDRERRFLYEFSVEKLGVLSFRGYLGVIESEKEIRIFRILFFLHMKCGVRVSASNSQVLTRKSVGARASSNVVHFLAGPARSNHQ